MKSIVQVVQNLIKPYIDNHDKANANLIAPVEVSPAEAAHSAGTQLIYNGKLYDVTVPIAIGDALATTGAGANISLSADISTLLKNIKADYVGLYGEVEINSATDLNTLQTIGNYYKTATNFAVTNAPTGIADDIQARFRLTVEKVLDSADSIVMQILTAITGESYYRIYGGVSWGDWEEITNKELTAEYQTLTNKLNNEIAARAMLSAHNLFGVGDFSEWFAAGSDGKAPLEFPASATITATTDKDTNSIIVTNYNTSGYRWGCKKVNLKKNTRYVFSFASINGTMRLFGKNDADAQGTLIANLPATVNTGDYDTYYVGFYPTVGGGYFSATNLLVRLETDADTTYQPYAKTNQQLTAEINELEKAADGLIYGFQINGSESDPAAAVTYLEDAVGMTPAHMDFSTGKFDYGSWENAFFMPRPCMLKSDGTVDYYLNPDNYALKEDGTASDIANTAYAGNAMMEWGRNGHKIWLKILPIGDGSSAKVYISNHRADSKFFDYPFHNCKGESAEHFYTPIYNGSVISNTMRSLSGQTVSKTLAGTAEITAAKANNPSTDELWNIECFADRLLINMLLILMGKSLNTQAVFGQGLNSGGSEAINDGFTTGVHNTKGLFYGTNDGTASTYTNAVKIFGMENYYGFQWRRTNGLILNNGATKYKLTYGTEDGSSATGYNTDGTDYKDAGVTPSGTSGGYISKAKFTEDGMFSDTMSGSASTYYCDGTWFNNTAVTFARFGGDSGNDAKVGAFYLSLFYAVSHASWSIGAALSCKPLA